MATDRPIHPDFDGHLERPLPSLSARDKLLYLSQQIEFRHLARRARRAPADDGAATAARGPTRTEG